MVHWNGKSLVPPSVQGAKGDIRGKLRRVIVCAFAFVPIVMVLVARGWSPDILAALILVPAWCWLLAGMGSLAAVLRAEKKRLACLLMLFWGLFAVVSDEEIPGALRLATERGRAAGEIRIVSLNCANTPKCLGDLHGVSPDLVLLQEAPGEDDLAQMARELFGASGSVLIGGDTAILARGSIEPKYVDRAGHFVYGTVTLTGGARLDCISLRLSPPPPSVEFWSPVFWTSHRDCRVEHRRQLRAVADQIGETARADVPFIIGGDFNTTPGDRSLLELPGAFRDAFRSSGVGLGGTGTNDWPLFRVDQIWLNGKLAPARTRAVKTAWSDHRMVVCDVEVDVHD